MMVALLLQGFVFLLLLTFQCLPVRADWDPFTPESSCLSIGASLEAGAALGIFEDVVILLLPIAEVSKLKMDWRHKAMLLLLFSIGALSVFHSHPYAPGAS